MCPLPLARGGAARLSDDPFDGLHGRHRHRIQVSTNDEIDP